MVIECLFVFMFMFVFMLMYMFVFMLMKQRENGAAGHGGSITDKIFPEIENMTKTILHKKILKREH